RVIKQAPELATIQDAIDATVKSLKTTLTPTKLKSYRYEYDVEAELTRGFLRAGAIHGFEPIIAGGPRACQIHPYTRAALGRGELLVLDVGAQVDHYSADITRTVAIQPPTKRQKQVYEAVLQVQEYALSLLKPGVNLHDYELEVEQFMGEKLRELGLIRSIRRESVRRYFPHATSHYLGLNVHDVGDRGPTGILEPGAVLTVEPGIYIPKEGIGIRIEDDVLITPTGTKVLSAALPRRLN
ncbi:MAG TPA: M24 family metallopeptidase, partial [Candidatus Saccharimonadales bacterium]|nr:M24 family metallopeptidase [Candidatus Saccharimonadales bacterium]